MRCLQEIIFINVYKLIPNHISNPLSPKYFSTSGWAVKDDAGGFGNPPQLDLILIDKRIQHVQIVKKQISISNQRIGCKTMFRKVPENKIVFPSQDRKSVE